MTNLETPNPGLSRRSILRGGVGAGVAGAAAATGVLATTAPAEASLFLPGFENPTTGVFSQSALMADVKKLTSFGWRRQGTQQLRNASAWLRTQFINAGLQTTVESWAYEAFYPTKWSAKVTKAPTPSGKIATLPYTTVSYPMWYSAPKKVEAEVVHVGLGTPLDFERVDVKGKIVLVESVYVLNFTPTDALLLKSYEAAVAKGAVGYIRTADAPKNLTRLMHLEEGIDKHTYKRNPACSIPAFVLGIDEIDAIRAALLKGKVTMELNLEIADVPFGGAKTVTGGSMGAGTHNLIAINQDIVGVLPGMSDDVVLVGAHYDSTYTGAMDNGTGVAGMLAVMRHFAAKKKSQRPKTMVFLAAAGHDAGAFDMTHFVNKHRSDIFPRVTAFAWLDHLAAAGSVHVTNTEINIPTGIDELKGVLGSLNPVLMQIVMRAIIGQGIIPPAWLPPLSSLMYVPTDVPCFDITTAHAWYHTVEDTIEKIPPRSLQQMVLALRDLLTELHVTPNALLRAAQPPISPTQNNGTTTSPGTATAAAVPTGTRGCC